MSITDDHRTHFAFGQNWHEFADKVDEDAIERATADLRVFVGSLGGQTVLDIGCGSGLHALAACRLGARVTAVDLDPKSVETAHAMLAENDASITVGNVFDLTGPSVDLIYSWGLCITPATCGAR